MIEEQIALEERMQGRGAAKVSAQLDDQIDTGRAAETGFGRNLLKGLVQTVAEELRAVIEAKAGKPGRRAIALVHLTPMDAEQAAYFAIRTILNKCCRDDVNHRKMQAVCLSIGQLVEDEKFCQRFKEQHREYFDAVLRSFKDKGTTNYQHKHRVLRFKANELDVTWKSWTQRERFLVGAQLVDIVMRVTDLIERNTISLGFKRPVTVLDVTPESLEWITNWRAKAEEMCPEHLPMIIEPADWVGLDDGGYVTPSMRARTPFVKTRSAQHRKILRHADLSSVMAAVNQIQRTPWQVNRPVLDVMFWVWERGLEIGLPKSQPYEMTPCPVPEGLGRENMNDDQLAAFLDWKREARDMYTAEEKRRAQAIQAATVVRTARDFSGYDSIWFVYTCDFRGRVYATTTFSPQGTDYSKGLLRFSRGVQLGADGFDWLCRHAANKFGFDKASGREQIQWVRERFDQIVATRRDPEQMVDFWSAADKPWQFLAACFEIGEIVSKNLDPQSYVSHLPVSLDGSCNGLQHYSAMLRDPVGAAATNLAPSDKPSDIYSEVAAVCSARIGEYLNTGNLRGVRLPSRFDDEDRLNRASNNWAGIKLTRDMAKKPVMTLPYGSTRITCTDSIYNWLRKSHPEIDKKIAIDMAVFMTPFLWESIGEVVVAGRAGMDWIQQAASVAAGEGAGLLWETPLGFPVFQKSMKIDAKRVETTLCGGLQLFVPETTRRVDPMKQRSGSAPNFVHSLDATHQMMTMLEASEHHSIRDFACIHDDFGVHAGLTTAFSQAIRVAFVILYDAHDPLLALKEMTEEEIGIELPPLPPRGAFDIYEVIASPYFFA